MPTNFTQKGVLMVYVFCVSCRRLKVYLQFCEVDVGHGSGLRFSLSFFTLYVKRFDKRLDRIQIQ